MWVTLVYLEQSEPTKSCTQCRLALELPYDMPAALRAKVYFRYASAKGLLNSFDDARKYFLLTQQLKPNCPGIAKRLEELSISQRRYEAQERFMYKKMFAQDTSRGTAATFTEDSESRATPAAAGNKAAVKERKECDPRHTTVDQGVIIAELDPSGKTTECNLHKVLDRCSINHDIEEENLKPTEYEQEVAKLPQNLKSEFVDIVLAELGRLVGTGGRVKEVMFPSNLCVDELAFLAVTASDHGCHLEFVHRGNVRYPKVVRGLDQA